ncbi:MAG: AMP-binding protein, partial [Methylococcales bacterium]|nr:AMP-binding protein [Methylococcales bacterium]
MDHDDNEIDLEEFPLSYSQERLWLLDVMSPGESVYNMSAAFKLAGQLNIPALEQAFQAIIDRHESLVTNFTTVDEQPVQFLREEEPFEVEQVTLATGQTLVEFAKEHGNRPFDLASDMLLRVAVVSLADAEYMLCISMHHIISDGLSVAVLMRELLLSYEACLQGVELDLPELEIQYIDYAEWQRDNFTLETMANDIAFWKNALSGVEKLKLVTDFPHAPLQTFAGGNSLFTIPKTLESSIYDYLDSESELTQYALLMSVYHLFLYRMTGQQDITVGTPVANRDRVELEPLIGFFVNTVVIRGQLEGSAGFDVLASQIKQQSIAAFTHQQVPFEMLVQALSPERDTTTTPFFQTMFSLQNAVTEQPHLSGVDMTPMDIDYGRSRFYLMLEIKQTEQGLVGCWEYNADLFSAARVSEFTEHFLCLLQSALASPTTALDQLPLYLSRQQTLAPHPKTSLINLFDKISETQPEQIAVVCGSGEYSYHWLQVRSNQIAQYLQQQGIKSGDKLAIELSSDIDAYQVLLATQRMGVSFIPVNTQWDNADREKALLTVKPAIVISETLHSDIEFNVVKLSDIPFSELTGHWEAPDVPQEWVSYGLLEQKNNEWSLLEISGLHHHVVVSGYIDRVKLEPESQYFALTGLTDQYQLNHVMAALSVGASVVCGFSLLKSRPVTHVHASIPLLQFLIRNPINSLKVVTAPALKGEVSLEGVDLYLTHSITEFGGCVAYQNAATNTLNQQDCISNITLKIESEYHQEQPISRLGKAVIHFSGNQYRLFDHAQKNCLHDIVTDEILYTLPAQVDSNEFSEASLSVDKALCSRLAEFCHRHELTKDAVLQSLFPLLLTQWQHVESITWTAADLITAQKNYDLALNAFSFVQLYQSDLANNPELQDLIVKPALKGCPLKHDDFHFQSIQGARCDELSHNAKIVMLANTSGNAYELTLKVQLGVISPKNLTALLNALTGLIEYFLDNSSAPVSAIDWLPKADALLLLGLSNETYLSAFAMSPVQHSLFLSAEINPNEISSSIGCAIELPKNIDVARLKYAVQQVSDANDLLRSEVKTLLQGDMKNVYFAVKKQKNTFFEAQTITDDTQLSSLTQAFINQPYILERHPLIRHKLVSTPSKCVLIVAMHHVMMDGFSESLYLNAVMQQYHCSTSDDPEQESVKPFSSFVPELRGQFDQAQAYQFWQKKREDIEPLDFKKLISDSSRIVNQNRLMTVSQNKEIQQYCNENSIPVARFLRGIYVLLLSHYCRAEKDFVVLNINAQRNEDNKAVLGCFFSAEPKYYAAKDFSGDLTCIEYFNHVGYSEAHDKLVRNVTTEFIKDNINTGRSTYIFNFFNFKSSVDIGAEQYPINIFPAHARPGEVHFVPQVRGDSIELMINYDVAVFDDLSFIDRYIHLVHQICHKAEMISDLSYLMPNEEADLQQLRESSAVSQQEIPRLLAPLLQHVKATPDAIALVQGDTQVSYRELDERSNKIANYLLDNGLKTNQPVAIGLSKSVDFSVAQIAILKAGGCYVPIDPSYPENRIEYILDNAEVKFLIHAGIDANIVCQLDLRQAGCLDGFGHEAPHVTIEPEQLAYIIYTSGSTGQPKGVAVTQKSVINLLSWYQKTLSTSATSKTLIISALGFDLTQKNLFVNLWSGGTVVFPESDYYDV